jgi:low affinity Fe/Cu permease
VPTLRRPTVPCPPPWLAASALVAAVASGLLFFHLGGAPAAYLPLNAASLLLALIAMFTVPAGRLGGRGAAWIVALCLAGIGATLVSGFDLDGVRRWLPLGPVRLHAALLLLPAMIAALSRLSDRWQLTAVTAVAAIILLQPDFASALALGAGFIASHWRRWREPLVAAGHAVVVLCAIASSFRADPLAPLRFVENMVADGWALHPGLGLLILAALFFAIGAPARTRGSDRDGALGISGAWAGFAAASLIGAYPTPLAGYGAAAILGYGLAIAVLRGLPTRG